jgi:hypothetical protein
LKLFINFFLILIAKEEKKEEKKVEKKAESEDEDGDMGFGLFD